MLERFRWSVITPLLLLLPGCGLVGRSTPPVDRSQEPRIQQAVQARLAAEPSLAAASIRVEVDGATVLLYGSVAGLGAWQCALTNAELVAGVSSVVDYLVIGRGPRDVRCLAPAPGAAVKS